MGGDLAPNLGGGTKNFFRSPISGKISIFRVKISDDLFFSHRPGSSDFSFLFPDFTYVYYVKCRIWPLPHKKNTIFHSVHAFTHIRQHYFSKYWGDQCMGGPPTSNFEGIVPPVPPRSPPLPGTIGSRSVGSWKAHRGEALVTLDEVWRTRPCNASGRLRRSIWIYHQRSNYTLLRRPRSWRSVYTPCRRSIYTLLRRRRSIYI